MTLLDPAQVENAIVTQGLRFFGRTLSIRAIGRFRHRKVQFIQVDLHLQQLHDLGAEFLESLQRRTLHNSDGRK